MILLAIAVPLLLSAQPSMKVSDEDAVRSAFSRYREALMKKDGAAAADAVDAGSPTTRASSSSRSAQTQRRRRSRA